MPASDVLLATVVTTLGVAACLIAEQRRIRWLEFIGKPAASLAFLLLAFTRAGDSTPERCFLVALSFSAAGDLALLGTSAPAFLAGLGAFLLGHVGFLSAFLARGVSVSATGLALLPLALIFVAVWRWLLPHVPGRMRVPVVLYMAVITLMVACSIGTNALQPVPIWMLAAACFFVSDLSVARRRFVAPQGRNRIWGLPLYFGAQLLFAANIGR